MTDVKETIKNKLLETIKQAVGKDSEVEIYNKIQYYKEFVEALRIESETGFSISPAQAFAKIGSLSSKDLEMDSRYLFKVFQNAPDKNKMMGNIAQHLFDVSRMLKILKNEKEINQGGNLR